MTAVALPDRPAQGEYITSILVSHLERIAHHLREGVHHFQATICQDRQGASLASVHKPRSDRVLDAFPGADPRRDRMVYRLYEGSTIHRHGELECCAADHPRTIAEAITSEYLWEDWPL